MVFGRSPILTRQRALNTGVVVDRDGNQLNPRRANSEDNERQHDLQLNERNYGGNGFQNQQIQNFPPISPVELAGFNVGERNENSHFSEEIMEEEDIRRRLLVVTIEKNQAPRNGGNTNGQNEVGGLYGNVNRGNNERQNSFGIHGQTFVRQNDLHRNSVENFAPSQPASPRNFLQPPHTSTPSVNIENRQRFGPFPIIVDQADRIRQIAMQQPVADTIFRPIPLKPPPINQIAANAQRSINMEFFPSGHRTDPPNAPIQAGSRFIQNIPAEAQLWQGPDGKINLVYPQNQQPRQPIMVRQPNVFPYQRNEQNFQKPTMNPYEKQFATQTQPNSLVPSNLEFNLILERIPDLNGNEGIDIVRRFFKKFDAYTDEWPNSKRILALESKVFNKAERALEAAKATQPYRYELIRREMLQQLEETDSKNLNAFDELMMGVRRKLNEPIDDLAGRISALVKRAYPGLTNNLSDEYSIKFLIRAMGNPDLALNLELIRTVGMTLDHFVSLAARAESAQRAAKRFATPTNDTFQHRVQTQKWRQNSVVNSNFGTGTGERFSQTYNTNHQSKEGPHFQWKCYNCGEPGHLSRNCTRPKDFSQNQDTNNQQNRNFVATGANRTQIQTPNNNKNTFKPNSSNFLKHNCLVVQREEVFNKARVNKVELAPEISEFYEKLGKITEEKGENFLLPIGKVMSLKVFIFEIETDAMLDGGAQISLIGGDFLHKLVKEKQVKLESLEIFKSKTQIFDVNGKFVKCLGTVKLPVHRHGFSDPVSIFLHITNAPIGFGLLIGTNALQDLGFKLYDECNKAMVEFEKTESGKRDFLTVIYRTTIEPNSVKNLELSIDSQFEGAEIVATPDENSVAAIRVEPTVGLAQKGKIIVPVTNFSMSAITLFENSKVGKVELAKSVEEAENFLNSQIICSKKNNPIAAFRLDAMKFLEILQTRTGDLPEEHMEKLQTFAKKFPEIFALSDEDLKQTNLVEHEIETEGKAPIKTKTRPVPYAYREKIAEMIQNYLGRGLIRPSMSPWASPIVIVPKRDGTLRFCVDYRGLNSITRKDCFPLPNIDNTLLMLGGRKFFSTLDFMSGYWQIKMEENSIEKTAFTTEYGLYEFMVMPFGLTNAVATFQRFMSRLFDGMINQFLFVYIDDILIASESFEEHLMHIELVFSRIKTAGLKLKLEKCHFCATELPFLGHILTREGIKMDADKLKPVIELPTPTTKKELHSLLGFLTYYRKFIHSFGTIAAPLFKLLSEKVEFKMGEKEKEALEELKSKIIRDVVLYFPDFKAAENDPSRQFIIMTDASKIGIAAVLCQPDPEKRIRPIYFASRQCNHHESRYSATELEALAVKFGVKKFAQFITMIPTRVITDHKALIWMFRSKNETGNSRVDRWLLELSSRFILKVEFQPGKKNVIADILSRSKAADQILEPKNNQEIALIGEVRTIEVADSVQDFTDHKEKWEEETKSSEMQPIYEFLDKKVVPNDPQIRQSVMDKCHRYTIFEKLLYLCEDDGKMRLFVPKSFRENLVRERHEGKCSGHMSGKKLYKQLSELYFWPNMLSDCIRFHLACRICAHTRNARSNEPPLKVVHSSEPLELVCMDILDIGPSQSNFKYICVIIDHFTKYLVAEPIPNKSADSVAKIFVEKFVVIFGTPKKIHSDRGKEFVNATLKGISKILGTEMSFTAGYDPQGNGLVERVNGIIIGMLKRSTASNWTWDERLPFTVFAYNITPTESTGFSPFLLMFGRPAIIASDKITQINFNPLYTIDHENYFQLFLENLLNIQDKAKQNLEEYREKSKEWYDAKPRVKANKFEISERVMVAFPGMHRNSRHKKLLWTHFGPYFIVKITDSSAEVVPVDKKTANPITVPLERLIKVPKSIPNISTLPRGKNPYKNILNAMILSVSVHMECQRREESLAENKQFGTIAIKGDEEGKEEKNGGKDSGINKSFSIKGTEFPLKISGQMNSDAGISWNSICNPKEEGHEFCSVLKLGELDPVLGQTGIGATIVQTPLQALLAIFLLRSGTVSSNTAARIFVELIIKNGPKNEMAAFSEKRGDYVETGKFPQEEDQSKALEKWLESCCAAREAVSATGFKSLAIGPPDGMETLMGTDQEDWKNVFEQSAWVLERVRAKVVHKAESFVSHGRVFVGDSSARLLHTFFDQSIHIGPDEGPIADVIRAFKPVVISSRVKVIVVIAGRDSLIAGETPEAIIEQFKLLAELCKRFTVQILWSCPPYVHQKQREFEALVAQMQHGLINDPPQILPICTAANGRSALEIFRFGEHFNMHMVEENGKMKNAGCRALRAWILSQTPFPGDIDMHIRTIRSTVVIPSGDRADHRSGNVNLGQSARDRADHRRVVSSSGQIRAIDRSNTRYRPYEIGHSDPNNRRHREFRPTRR